MVSYTPKTSIKHLSSHLKNVRVLVCDPDLPIANIVKHVLNNLGFGQVYVEHNSQSAITRFKNEPIDLIIADTDTLEGQDGFELVKFVRTASASPNPFVPIIMLSGNAERRDVEWARDQGITEFSAKPFTAKALCDRIVRVIENPRSFIITKRYTGPDRRNRKITPPDGQEKRKSGASLASGKRLLGQLLNKNDNEGNKK
jgi:two-component system chemotaxis response regulator CheY